MLSDVIENLYKKTMNLYKNRNDLLYHGWHHIEFVRKKSMEFAKDLNANCFLVESSAILHDTNYLIEPYSECSIAKELRAKLLSECGIDFEDSQKIECIINEANLKNRKGKDISLEAQALSDADTLFKALPITPILLTHRYLSQTGLKIEELGQEIIKSQTPLLERGVYFYSKIANNNYIKWAETNLQLWNNIMSSLEDPVIRQLVDTLQLILKMKSNFASD